MTYRERALRVALWEAKRGVHEEGFSNRGKYVDRYQDADDLPGRGYPWCMAFVQWCYQQAGHPLRYRTASVGLFQSWARRIGWVVQKPQRGDIVCFNFDADNWADHVGLVTRALPGGWIRTVEGNTSAGTGGSQADGGGVHRRLRRTSRCAFVRVPGKPISK
jgi:hypothetical protein